MLLEKINNIIKVNEFFLNEKNLNDLENMIIEILIDYDNVTIEFYETKLKNIEKDFIKEYFKNKAKNIAIFFK